ncbi:tRNA-binding protein [Nitrolancea hollandica]|uniref:Molecular chaperone n=1 Tax=Nitrolancea hollandica Lb TaxID=1129897 RepID=I4EI17_9BACT|nr:tRNA-binding protein [Nitrolancea hollandica]CCF84329.1 molecular chaperone [Nitrolancea hollandica Lb]
MATFEEFEKLDMRTGVIREVEPFPRARKPSFRLTIDFGPEIGSKQTSAQVTNYRPEELIGMSIIAVVNFPPKNIAGFRSEVLVLGVPGEGGQISLLTPSRPAPLGGRVY